MLYGFDSVFRREFSHDLCPLAIGCHLHGSAINPLNIGGSASTATVHSYDELYVGHDLFHFERKAKTDSFRYADLVQGT
jgi:hypothetical protein